MANPALERPSIHLAPEVFSLLLAPRSRRARAAALSLALAAPILAATATPAFASGESTNAVLTSPASGSATTFTWSYTFGGGTHALSNIAIGFCSAAILADVHTAGSYTVFTTGDVKGGHDGFGPGVKFDLTAATGTFTVTFDTPHAIAAGSVRVQSHSGDGQTGDIITTAAGPSCSTDTGSVPTPPADTPPANTPPADTPPAANGDNPQQQTIVDNHGHDADGNQTGGSQTSGDPAPSAPTPSITSDPAPTTAVLGETVVKTDDPAPADPAPAPALAPASAPAPTAVEGAALAHTGANDVDGRVELGFGLLGLGLVLRAISARRRHSSASSIG